jgi:hypothetical protein
MSITGIGYASAIALAILLLVAAAAKALAPVETARSFAALGVPRPDAAARFVPLPEVAAAVLLLIVPAIGGIATLMLLAFFSTFVVTRLRAGIAAPCACFGAASSAPLSWLTLVRNCALGLLGLASLVTLRPVMPSWADVVAVTTYVVLMTVLLQFGERRAAAPQG